MAKKNIVKDVASAVGAAAGVAASRVEGLKSKRSPSTKHSKAKVAEAAGQAVAAPSVEENTPAKKTTLALDHQEVARIAYLRWETRGGQNGSPEQDWVLAEQELMAKRSHKPLE